MATSRSADGNKNAAAHHADVNTPLLRKTSEVFTTWSNKVADALENWFAWELVSAAIALLSFVAIVIVLVDFDDSALPDWPSIFTINSIVSIFSSFSQICLMAATGASVAQAKWLWYRRNTRPLSDIQLFNNASRGPWGALAFLLTFHISSIASLGSTVIVLSLLYGPFIQQLVGYHDKLVPSSKEASIVRAQRYPSPSHEGLPLPSVVDLSMKAAIYNGIFDTRNSANSSTEFQCSTGNCNFDPFASLAVGSTCINITDHVTYNPDSLGHLELSLPGGLSLSGSGGQINTSVSNISSELYSVRASVVQFAVLISHNTKNSVEAVAWECSLYYCVNEYKAAVNNGNLLQVVANVWRNDSASYTQDGNLSFRPPASVINTTTDISSFYVDSEAAKALNSFMSSSFTGSGEVKDNDSKGSAFSSDTIHGLYEADNLPTRMDNLAMSMSNNLRQQNDSGSYPFQGTALQFQTFLQVRWVWVVYPAVVLTFGICCLLATIIGTEGERISVWKTSEIALLFHGRRLRLRNDDSVSTARVSAMTRDASEMKVGLIQADDGSWTLQQ